MNPQQFREYKEWVRNNFEPSEKLLIHTIMIYLIINKIKPSFTEYIRASHENTGEISTTEKDIRYLQEKGFPVDVIFHPNPWTFSWFYNTNLINQYDLLNN